MKIDVYRSSKHSGKHISVPAGTDITTIQFPADLDPHYLEVGAFRKDMEIEAGDQRIGIDSAEVIKKINTQGYALHGVKISFTEN